MKFSSTAAFEKHLKEACPHHLSHVYMVLTPSDFERKMMMGKAAEAIESKGQMEKVEFDAASAPIEEILEKLNSYSLFGGDSLVLVDHVEKLKKLAMEALAGYLAAPSERAYLILGSASSKGISELYQKGKKELIILDLSDEKPWDRKSRLLQWLLQEASRAGKTLSSSLAEHLLEEVGTDMQTLHQEMEKLICFVGDKREIEWSDAKAISSSFKSETAWQIADSLVWGDGVCKQSLSEEISFLLTLIGPLRFQLGLGLQIASLMQEGKSLQEMSAFLPNVKSRNLEKNAGVVRRKGPRFFQEGLIGLFELELSLKNGTPAPGLMWDLFISKLSRMS